MDYTSKYPTRILDNVAVACMSMSLFVLFDILWGIVD
jgi:hypothetical protein